MQIETMPVQKRLDRILKNSLTFSSELKKKLKNRQTNLQNRNILQSFLTKVVPFPGYTEEPQK